MFTIELATAADAPDVIDLLLAQLQEHEIATPRDAIEIAVLGMLAEASRGFILVARQGGATAGVAWVSFTWSLEHGGLTSWLEELYVVPAERERGLGRAMLADAMARARAAGCAAMDLEVTDEHTRAANLYLREAFVRLPRTRYVKPL